LGLGLEFGLQRIRNLAIVCPESVGQKKMHPNYGFPFLAAMVSIQGYSIMYFSKIEIKSIKKYNKI
jgi:hypothetical protein